MLGVAQPFWPPREIFESALYTNHKRNQEGDQGGPWTPLEGAELTSESAKKDFRRSKNARLRLV